MELNFIDWFVILLMAYSIYSGVKRGFVIQVTSFLGLLLGVYFAFKFSGVVGQELKKYLDLGNSLGIISLILTFVLTVLGIRFLGFLVKKLIKVSLMNWLDRVLGLVLSLLKVTAIIGIVFMIINNTDFIHNLIGKENTKNSVTFQFLSDIIPTYFEFLKDWYDESIKPLFK